MIKSFQDRMTEDIFRGINSKEARKFPIQLHTIAKRKLDIIEYAFKLSQLALPPGNRLEALKGNYAGYHSIRINEQWRIIFKWQHDYADDVQIIDYH